MSSRHYSMCCFRGSVSGWNHQVFQLSCALESVFDSSSLLGLIICYSTRTPNFNFIFCQFTFLVEIDTEAS